MSERVSEKRQKIGNSLVHILKQWNVPNREKGSKQLHHGFNNLRESDASKRVSKKCE